MRALPFGTRSIRRRIGTVATAALLRWLLILRRASRWARTKDSEEQND